jgi:hypothetical protein
MKIGELEAKLYRGVRLSLWAAAMIAASGMTLATAQVQYFINVQPIDVCSSDGTGCAPIAGPGAQIGFVDPNTGQDITRAIFNQFGIDVSFLPVAQYNAPDSSLQNLQVIPGATPGQLTSPTFQNLSNQLAISQGLPPNPNTFNVPLGSDPHAINMLFVSGLQPAQGVTGVLYGFSWIGNNGVSIGANTFGAVTPRGTLLPRPDTLAHELGHDLGLDHPTDNPGQPANNLMSMGSIPRTEPLAGNGLPSVSLITSQQADQLNSAQIAQIINPNGAVDANGNPILNPFLNPIPLVNTTASDPILAGFNFNVSFDKAGRPNESLRQLTLRLPFGFFFNSPVTITSNSDPDVVVTPTFGNSQNGNCTARSEGPSNCIVFTFSAGAHALENGDKFSYNVGICRQTEDGCVAASDNDLEAAAAVGNLAIYNYLFSDGYGTTSDLVPMDGTMLLAGSSQTPDLTIPTSLDLNLFTPFSTNLPCVMQPGATGCPSLILADADPAEEGGQFPVVPEPPGVLILLSGLAVWLAIDRSRRWLCTAMPLHRR